MHTATEATKEEVSKLERIAVLRAEAAQARTRLLASAAHLRLLLYNPAADLDELADAAVATGMEGQRLAGFARLLKRSLGASSVLLSVLTG